jgi:hypothetical protein
MRQVKIAKLEEAYVLLQNESWELENPVKNDS